MNWKLKHRWRSESCVVSRRLKADLGTIQYLFEALEHAASRNCAVCTTAGPRSTPARKHKYKHEHTQKHKQKHMPTRVHRVGVVGRGQAIHMRGGRHTFHLSNVYAGMYTVRHRVLVSVRCPHVNEYHTSQHQNQNLSWAHVFV